MIGLAACKNGARPGMRVAAAAVMGSRLVTITRHRTSAKSRFFIFLSSLIFLGFRQGKISPDYILCHGSRSSAFAQYPFEDFFR